MSNVAMEDAHLDNNLHNKDTEAECEDFLTTMLNSMRCHAKILRQITNQ